MKFFRRKMESETLAEEYSYAYQAAYNSDGGITLRGFRKGLDPKPEFAETMLVLSEAETEAIFKLFRKFARHIKADDLPF